MSGVRRSPKDVKYVSKNGKKYRYNSKKPKPLAPTAVNGVGGANPKREQLCLRCRQPFPFVGQFICPKCKGEQELETPLSRRAAGERGAKRHHGRVVGGPVEG